MHGRATVKAGLKLVAPGELGGVYANTIKRDVRDIERKRDINVVSKAEERHLPIFQEWYMWWMEEPFLTHRKGTNAISTTDSGNGDVER